MTYESKSFKEHHLTRLPVLERLLLLGWEREQIICPSPNSDDTEWHVPKTPSEATNQKGVLKDTLWILPYLMMLSL